MWTYTHTDELCHYGIPGMKWGQRKAAYQTYKSDLKKARKDNSDTKNANARRLRKAIVDNYKVKKQRKIDLEKAKQKAVDKYQDKLIEIDRKSTMEAVKKSNYGKTNSQILVDGAVKGAVGYLAAKGISKFAANRGHDYVAAFVSGAGDGWALGQGIGTTLQVATNYVGTDNKKRK